LEPLLEGANLEEAGHKSNLAGFIIGCGTGDIDAGRRTHGRFCVAFMSQSDWIFGSVQRSANMFY
jgi:hypothetical protein